MLYVENKHLPTFGGKLSTRESELLLSYLTVPYLRIPLVLSFFASPERTNTLSHPDIQRVIECVVYEPGSWLESSETVGQDHADRNVLPDMIPALNRDHLATPAGLLLNELTHSPTTIVKALQLMLENAFELDAGRADAKSTEAILFTLRLVSGVLEYINCCLKRETKSLMARGLRIMSKEAADLLQSCSNTFKTELVQRGFPMMSRWISTCSSVTLSCKLRAHIAYIFKGFSPNSAIPSDDEAWAASIFCSQIYLFSSFDFDMEPTRDLPGVKMQKSKKKPQNLVASNELGIDQLDMFDTFTRHRRRLLHYLRNHSDTKNELMEEIIRVVTQMHEVAKERPGSPTKRRTNFKARTWSEISDGRYAPDTDLEELKRRSKSDQIVLKSYEEWLRHKTSTTSNTEISLQLGEFTLKQHRVEPIRRSVSSLSDFTDVFGKEETNLHCAEVRHTQNRYYWRLVGRRHDIYLWKSPNEDCWPPLRHRGEFSRRFPTDMKQGTEAWILSVLNKVFRGNSYRVEGLEYHLQSSPCTRNATFARLCVSGSNDKGVILKEMIVFRDPAALQLYDIVEHGRRWYRTLTYTSSTTHVRSVRARSARIPIKSLYPVVTTISL